MKIIKSVALSALLCTSILSAPASAFVLGTADIDDPSPAGINAADAQAVCDALAAIHGTAWTGTLEQGSIDGSITSGPTANGDPVMVGSATPGDGAVQIGESVQVNTDPFRIGGSVNMFGMAHVVAAHWDFSQYDITQSFTWQSSYTFTCGMSESVVVPATGHHEWHGPSTAIVPQQACLAADNNVHFDTDQGQCVFVVDVAEHNEDQDRNPEQGNIGPVTEGGTLNGHENHGASIPVNPDEVSLPDIQVVVCISPGKKGGTWTKKNGYNGSLCTTVWYNSGAITSSPYTNINSSSNNIVTIPTS